MMRNADVYRQVYGYATGPGEASPVEAVQPAMKAATVIRQGRGQLIAQLGREPLQRVSTAEVLQQAQAASSTAARQMLSREGRDDSPSP